MTDDAGADAPSSDAASGDESGADAAVDDALGDGTDVPDDETVLDVDGLTKYYGGVTALDDLSVRVGSGITGLIGPNGAGKTTFFDCVTGFEDPDAGTIRFGSADLVGERPSAVAERGLVRTFQIPRVLRRMTVRENLQLAAPDQHGEHLSGAWLRRSTFVGDERRSREDAVEMAEFFELDHLLDEHAGNLSGGQRKLLELARVLMTDPDFVLLDEPLAGVNPTLEDKIIQRLHDLAAEEYSFLLVEHDISTIMETCERVVVFHNGRVLTAGPPEAVRRDERVIEAYLGGEE